MTDLDSILPTVTRPARSKGSEVRTYPDYEKLIPTETQVEARFH